MRRNKWVLLVALGLLAAFGSVTDAARDGDRVHTRRQPTATEVSAAEAAYRAAGGKFMAEAQVDGTVRYHAYAPKPVTADTLAKLPDLLFEYDLRLELDGRAVPGCLKPLARLTDLRSVLASAPSRRVSDPDTPALVAELRHVPNLELLNLGRDDSAIGLTDDLADWLAGFPALRHLVVSGPVSDDGLASLSRCPKLRALVLDTCPYVTDAGLAHLAGMPSLRELHVRNCPRLTASALRPFTSQPRLTRLEFGGDAVGAEVVDDIGRIGSLERVCVSSLSTPITEAGYRALGRLTRLRVLHGPPLQPTDAGLKALAGATELEVLNLRGTFLTGAAYEEIGKWKRLRRLSISPATGLTDEGLSYLAGLERLEFLQVPWANRTTDAGWRRLVAGRGARLTGLVLIGSAVTDGFVADLSSKAPGLTLLQLNGTEGVTDKCVESLVKLGRLDHLDLSGTRVTDEALVTVTRRFPRAYVAEPVRKR